MLKHLLKDFFKFECKNDTTSYKAFLDKKVLNSDLVKELLLIKDFKLQWRNKIDYSLEHEDYHIKILSKTMENDIAKVNVKIVHGFSLKNIPNIHKSAESLFYVFVFKKIKLSWFIIDLYNKEFSEDLYNKILNSKLKDYKIVSRDEDINYWENKISSINKMASEYNIASYKYRTNYIDKDYPKKYDHEKAIAYARTYALNYNKDYESFSSAGGDCTNFISQCLKSGKLKESSIWKPYTNAWIRVNDLYSYLLRKGLGTDSTKNKNYKPGSILQFYNNKTQSYSHSALITYALANGDYLYCCHSYDKLDYPLSEIYPLYYNKFRIIEILY